MLKMQATTTKVKNLVLDAGPLLSLAPLRGLAGRYLTVPQVLDELKDKRAREHFERLALTAGVQIEIRNPDAVALLKGQHGLDIYKHIFTVPFSHGICEKDRGLCCAVARRFVCAGFDLRCG